MGMRKREKKEVGDSERLIELGNRYQVGNWKLLKSC